MAIPTEIHRFDALPPELLLALGKVAAHLGQIEHILALTLRRTDQIEWAEAFRIARKRDIPEMRKKVLDVFNRWAASKFTEPELSERKSYYDQILSEIERLAKDRNDVIHCAWGLSDTGQLRATREGRALYEDRPIELADVVKLGDDLLAALWKLNAATFADPPPPLNVWKSVPGETSLTVSATATDVRQPGFPAVRRPPQGTTE